MNQANDEKIADLEQILKYSPTTKSLLDLEDDDSQLSEESNHNSRNAKMQKIQHFLFVLLLLVVLVTGVVCTSSNNVHGRNPAPAPAPARSPNDAQKFQELLNSVEPASLHEILHIHLKEKYKHGVYQEDKTAMEVVHQQNAEVATSLVEMAKRQTSGSSNATMSPTSSTTPPPRSSSSSSTSSTPPASTSSSSSAITSPSPTSPSSVSQTPPPTASSETTPVSKAQPSSSTTKDVSSPTHDSSTSKDTIPSSITQSIIYKTTLAGGGVSTITSVTVVPADGADGSGSGPKTNTANASLQTGAANKMTENIILGAFGLAVVAAL